jgi:hypothetical protein
LNGPTGSELEPVEEEEEAADPVETSSDGADFSACEGLTGLDNAICRHQALLVVHPDNRGLRYSLGQLQENRAEHEGSAGGGGHSGDDPSEGGSNGGASSSGHGQSGESHGNAGGNGHANAGGNGNGHANAGGNGNGNANGH